MAFRRSVTSIGGEGAANFLVPISFLTFSISFLSSSRPFVSIGFSFGIEGPIIFERRNFTSSMVCFHFLRTSTSFAISSSSTIFCSTSGGTGEVEVSLIFSISVFKLIISSCVKFWRSSIVDNLSIKSFHFLS